jgi:CheY-like chemotaxis protein
LTSLLPEEDRPSASPFPSARDGSEDERSEGSADPAPRTVLLLEDNPTDVFVIREVIESCGLNLDLRIARDGREALQYLQDLGPDHSSPCPALVLLDLNVPKVDGIEFLRHLRESRCSHTPVVVVTSSTAGRDRHAAQQLGAEEYFQKPKDLTAYMELAKVIKRVLHPPEEGEER